MKWKLSDLASIAEIIAALGVIFSLAFVGLQISDGNSEIGGKGHTAEFLKLLDELVEESNLE